MAKKNRELTEQEKNVIKKLDTAFIPMLAKAFGVSSQTVSGILAVHRHSEKFPPKRKAATSTP